MSTLTTSVIDDICQKGTISDADVLRLRRMIYGEASITAAQAEQLFRVNGACSQTPQTWRDFFIEAVTDYTVNEAEPRGYLTLDNAKWLIGAIGKSGKSCSRIEFELAVNILEKARWVPESLVKFALDQIKSAIISGQGDLRRGIEAKKGEITEGEVELLRRVIYAFAGDGNVAVTRAEAEVLFEINDAVASASINPAFTDLFVKAVMNALMAASGYQVPTREEALKGEAFLDSRGDFSIDSVIANMARTPILSIYKEQTPEQRAIARLERQRMEIITNEEVTQGEVEWLVERLGRDGKLTPNEQALVAVLKRENPKIHPAFGPAMQRLRRAA